MNFFHMTLAFFAGQLVNAILVRIEHPETFGDTVIYPAFMLIVLVVGVVIVTLLRGQKK